MRTCRDCEGGSTCVNLPLNPRTSPLEQVHNPVGMRVVCNAKPTNGLPLTGLQQTSFEAPVYLSPRDTLSDKLYSSVTRPCTSLTTSRVTSGLRAGSSAKPLFFAHLVAIIFAIFSPHSLKLLYRLSCLNHQFLVQPLLEMK